MLTALCLGWYTPVNPSLGRQKQEDMQFKDCLGYTVSLGLTVIYWATGDPDSKATTKRAEEDTAQLVEHLPGMEGKPGCHPQHYIQQGVIVHAYPAPRTWRQEDQGLKVILGYTETALGTLRPCFK